MVQQDEIPGFWAKSNFNKNQRLYLAVYIYIYIRIYVHIYAIFISHLAMITPSHLSAIERMMFHSSPSLWCHPVMLTGWPIPGSLLRRYIWGFPARHGGTPKSLDGRLISRGNRTQKRMRTGGSPMTKRKPPHHLTRFIAKECKQWNPCTSWETKLTSRSKKIAPNLAVDVNLSYFLANSLWSTLPDRSTFPNISTLSSFYPVLSNLF